MWKKCAGRKKARPAKKSHNGVPAEKQSKKTETNAKVVVQKSQGEACWVIRRHPIGLYLAVKQDKTVYNGWKGRGGGEGAREQWAGHPSSSEQMQQTTTPRSSHHGCQAT